MIFILSVVVVSLAVAHGASLDERQSAWVDVCDYQDPYGSKCCASGMQNKEYMVVPEVHDWSEHSLLCDLYGGHLVIFETRSEWSCVEHWVSEAYQPSFQRYAISLRADFNHVGDYRWIYNDGSSAIPEFFIWAEGHPRNDPCVSMEIGKGVDSQGDWLDGACIEDMGLHAICEREKRNA